MPKYAQSWKHREVEFSVVQIDVKSVQNILLALSYFYIFIHKH